MLRVSSSGTGPMVMRTNCATTCSPSSRSNAACPVSAVNNVAPNPYTSDAALAGCPDNTSGAVYAGDPVNTPVAVSNPPVR
jgi:hypothetical protein